MTNIDKSNLETKINNLVFWQLYKRYILRCSLDELNLTTEEMKKIDGGGINIGLWIGIGAGVSFLIGLIDGIIRPLKCN